MADTVTDIQMDELGGTGSLRDRQFAYLDGVYAGADTSPSVSDMAKSLDISFRGGLLSEVGPSEPLAPGVRASAGTAGYLGSMDDLTVLNYGDSFVGTALEGTASNWSDAFVLNVKGDNIVLDGYHFPNAMVLHNSGVDLTIRNSVVHAPQGASIGITDNGPNQGTLTIEDTTIICDPGPGTARVLVGVSHDGRLIMRRCDVSGSGDLIHVVGYQGADFNTGSIISQCYMHDFTFSDPEQHVDFLQVFNAMSTYISDVGQTYLLIEHCATDQSTSPEGIPASSGITMGFPNDTFLGPWISVKVDNCYIPRGLNHIRVQYRQNNTVVTNNDFGFRNPSEVALSGVEAAAVTNGLTWTNNIDGNGAPYNYNDLGPLAP